MEEEKRTRTVVLGDSRGDGRCLRVTWHPSTHIVVFSHWSGSLCIASTPVKLPEAAKVIDLLVSALAERAKAASEPTTPADGQAGGIGARLAQRMLRRLRPAGATVLRLASSSDEDRARGSGA